MSDLNKADERDEVLFAFHQAYEQPTAEEIATWTSRFPQFAEDIRAHAAIALDWVARKAQPPEELDEGLAARCYSQVLNLMYDAAQTAEQEEVAGAALRVTPFGCGGGDVSGSPSAERSRAPVDATWPIPA